MIKDNIRYIAESLEAQVTQVGAEFNVNLEGDAEIYRLQGIPSGVFGDKLMRFAEPEWIECPSYHNDAARCIEALESLSITLFILPTEDMRKRKPKPFAQEYIAVFEKAAVIYATLPFINESAAAACALWYALGISHD